MAPLAVGAAAASPRSTGCFSRRRHPGGPGGDRRQPHVRGARPSASAAARAHLAGMHYGVSRSPTTSRSDGAAGDPFAAAYRRSNAGSPGDRPRDDRGRRRLGASLVASPRRWVTLPRREEDGSVALLCWSAAGAEHRRGGAHLDGVERGRVLPRLLGTVLWPSGTCGRRRPWRTLDPGGARGGRSAHLRRASYSARRGPRRGRPAGAVICGDVWWTPPWWPGWRSSRSWSGS